MTVTRKKNIDIQEAITGEEMDVDEIPDTVAPVVPAPPVAAAPVATGPSVTLTFEQMKELMGLSSVQATEMMTSAMAAQSKTNAEAAARVRNPIPEGTDASYPRISVLNPLGERDHPRPGLKCEFFLGTRMPKTKQVQRTYPWVADDLSAHEQIALNTLVPTSKTILLRDDSEAKCEVVATSADDITGEITRMVVVLPPHLLEKKSQSKNNIPGICDLVAQLTGRDFARLSPDDLAWFMAEHRKKHFVSVRESVAA